MTKRLLGHLGWLLLALSVLITPMIVPQAAFATASLGFSPSSGQVSAGSSWATTVIINSDGAVTAVDTTVLFSPNILQVTGIDFGGSVFSSSYPGSGDYDNAAGSAHIVQAIGNPSARYSGNGGKVATITFKAIATGSAVLAIGGGSKITAYDANASNVFSGGGSAGVNVVAASSTAAPTVKTTTTTNTTRTPTISSSSHPNQNAWYNSRSIAYSWTTTGTGYNFTVDQNPTTDLPPTVVGSAASSSVTVTSDGLWYAHVKAQGPNGWSQTAHFRFQVDTAVPAAFSVTTNPAGDVTVLPTINFEAKDDGSGIDHYEVQFDGGSWSRQNSGFKSPNLDSGSHTVLVRAFDKAGNTTDSQATFTLRQLDAPTITSPSNKQLLMLGEQLKVKGKAAPNVQVDVYINNKKVETTSTDNNGNFTTSQPLLLFAGAYQIVARAINKDGISSAPSAPVTLTIDARAVKLFGNVWPGWVVLVGVVVVIGLLVLGLGILAYLLWRKSSIWAAKLQGLDDSVSRDLALLEAHVDSSIDTSLGAMAPEATTIKTALNSEIATVKQDVDTIAHTTPNVRVKPPRPSMVDRLRSFIKRVTPHVSFGPATVTAVATEAVTAVPAAAPAITMPATPPPAFTTTTPAEVNKDEGDQPAGGGQQLPVETDSQSPVIQNSSDGAAVGNPPPPNAPGPSTNNQPAPIPTSDSHTTVLSAPTTAFPVADISHPLTMPQPAQPPAAQATAKEGQLTDSGQQTTEAGKLEQSSPNPALAASPPTVVPAPPQPAPTAPPQPVAQQNNQVSTQTVNGTTPAPMPVEQAKDEVVRVKDEGGDAALTAAPTSPVASPITSALEAVTQAEKGGKS